VKNFFTTGNFVGVMSDTGGQLLLVQWQQDYFIIPPCSTGRGEKKGICALPQAQARCSWMMVSTKLPACALSGIIFWKNNHEAGAGQCPMSDLPGGKPRRPDFISILRRRVAGI
jgi:hypothetical protein